MAGGVPETDGPKEMFRNVFQFAEVIQERVQCFGKIPNMTLDYLQGSMTLLAAAAVMSRLREVRGEDILTDEEWQKLQLELFNAGQAAFAEVLKQRGFGAVVRKGKGPPGGGSLRKDRN